MSTTTLKIQIEALVAGLQQIGLLSNEIKKVVEQSSKMGAASEQAASGLKKVPKEAEAATNALKDARKAGDELTGAFKRLVLPLAALAGIKVSFDFLADAAKYAARTETLGITLNVVAKNAGYSAEQISSYEKELKKLGITSQAARESMTALVQAGIPLEKQAGATESNVSKLARAAQDLAVVTGQNSSETLRRLVTNIQQMDTMGLRFMGLTVNVEAAQQKFAQSLNTTAGALTQQQKIMAVNNAVLEEAAKLQGAYEASMESVGKKVASLTRYQDELSDAIGKKLLPAYGAVVDSATDLLKTLEEITSATDASGEQSAKFGEAVKGLSNAFDDLVVAIAKVITNNLELIQSIASTIAGIGKDVLNFITSLYTAVDATGAFNAALYMVGLAFAGIRDGIQLAIAALRTIAAAFADVIGTIIQGYGELARVAGFDDLADSLMGAAASLKAFAKANDDAAGVIIQNFKDGRTATQGFLEGVNKLGPALSDFGKGTNFKQVAEELQLLTQAAKDGSMTQADFAEASKRVTEDIIAMGSSGKYTKAQIQALIDGAQEAGLKLPENFKNAETVLKSVGEAAKKSAELVASLGKNQSYEGLLADLNNVIQAQQRGTIVSADAAKAFEMLSAAVAKFGESGTATSAQTLELQKLLASVGGKISEEFTKAMTDMGLSVDQLASGIDPKFKLIAESLKILAANGQATAEQFRAAFAINLDTAKSVTQLEALSQSILAAKQHAENFGRSGNTEQMQAWLNAAAEAADLAKVKFSALFQSSLDAAKTEADFNRLAIAVNDFAKETGQSSEWVASKLESISVAANKAAQEVKDSNIAGALKAIGMSAEEMHGMASKAITELMAGFASLREDAKVTADEYYRVFSKGLDMSKSIADVTKFKDELNTALNQGKIGWQEYSAGMENVSAKFNEVFESSLKAAHTSEDFAQLREQVRNAGLSASQTAMYMEKIQEAASGAREEVQRLAQQQTEAAQEATRSVQAQVEATKAGLAVQQAHNELVKAELTAQEEVTRARSEGTEEAKKSAEAAQQEVEVAKINVQLQKDKAELAQLSAKQEAANYALLIAQQQLLNAEKEKERNPGDEEAQKAVEAAQKEVEAKQLVVEQTKQAVEQQQQNVARTEEASAEAQQLANNLRAAAEEAAHTAENSRKVRDWVKDSAGNVIKIAGYSFEGVVKQFQDIGYSLDKANVAAKELMGGMQQVVAYGTEGIKKYREITEAIKEAKEAKEQDAEAARQITEQYNQIKDSIEDANLGLGDAGQAMQNWQEGANEVAEAYRSIKRDAASALQSAEQAARAFSKSMTSIHEELLNAQGREDEASASRFATRRNELKLEYEILQVTIKTAIAKAKAAGVSTQGLEESAAAAASSYQQAQKDLDALEKLEQEKLRKKKVEEAQRKQEQVAKDLENNKRLDADNKRLSENEADRDRQNAESREKLTGKDKETDAEAEARRKRIQEEQDANKLAEAKQDAINRERRSQEDELSHKNRMLSLTEQEAETKRRSIADAISAESRLASLRQQASIDELRYSNEVVSLRNRATEEQLRSSKAIMEAQENADAIKSGVIQQNQLDKLKSETMRQGLMSSTLSSINGPLGGSYAGLQSIAENAIAASNGGPRIGGEYMTVKFTSDKGEEVDALVQKAEKDDFLELLNQARAVA